MKFGTIGAGAVALGFAREALRAGHQVMLSNRRGPHSLADVVAELGNGASASVVAAAASLEYVLLAVPWSNVEDALGGLPPWNGRVLIDATNPFSAYSPKLVLADLGDKGASGRSGVGARRAGREGVQFDRHQALQSRAHKGRWPARHLCLRRSCGANRIREESHRQLRLRTHSSRWTQVERPHAAGGRSPRRARPCRLRLPLIWERSWLRRFWRTVGS